MKFYSFLLSIFIPLITSSPSHAFSLVSSSITAGWSDKTLSFNVNESSCTSAGVTAEELNAAIDAAVDLWNSAPTTSIKFTRGSVVTTTTPSNPPTIYCSNTGQSDGVAGTGTISQVSAGRPATGAIMLNADSTKGAYFGNLSATYQGIIVAHEMGHVLGIGHSEKTYALMYYDISSKQNLNLSQDDVDGLTWLNPSNEFSSGLMGCGTIRDIGGKFPPSNDSGAVAFNWMMLFAFIYIITKLSKKTARA